MKVKITMKRVEQVVIYQFETRENCESDQNKRKPRSKKTTTKSQTKTPFEKNIVVQLEVNEKRK